MSLKIPDVLEHYWHDAIVKVLIKLNPQYHSPNRGSWLEGVPDLEDADREVVEVALTNLRDSWGQCLYYYRMNATHIHLVLSPKLYIDYQNKERAFIRANPIPNADVYTLPAIPVHSNLKKPTRKNPDRKPEAKFAVTKKEAKNLKRVEQPNFDSKEGLDLGIDNGKFEICEYPKVEVIKEPQKLPLKERFTCSKCKDLVKEENCVYPVCQKYNWEIASDLTERDAVCEE